jgi:HPr kinase/phosphorylase
MVAEQIHATCVTVDGRGVILRGPSSSGKSDLALRLIDQGGMLVADDRVDLRLHDGDVVASSPQNIAGQLEVRGVGIIRLAYQEDARVDLIIDLVERDVVPRLPEGTPTSLLGVNIQHLQLHAFYSSTPIKIRLALGGSKDAMVAP